MLGLLSLIPGFLSFFTTVTTKVFDAKVAIIQAKTGADRDTAVALAKTAATEAHESTERIAAIASSTLLTLLVVSFAVPLVVYEFKIIVIDKVLGWGTTDPITGLVADWANTIIVGIFGSTTSVALGKMWMAKNDK